jgi:hypothetical protein
MVAKQNLLSSVNISEPTMLKMPSNAIFDVQCGAFHVVVIASSADL